MKNEEERTIIKMTLVKLSGIVEEMNDYSSRVNPSGRACSFIVYENDPLRVSDLFSVDDFNDAVKFPLIVGDFSVTANPSYLTFYIGISSFVINMNVKNKATETILESTHSDEYQSLIYPLWNFYNNCIVTSYNLCRKDITNEISSQEHYINMCKGKTSEYNDSGDISRLEKARKVLLDFDQKFSKYKK